MPASLERLLLTTLALPLTLAALTQPATAQVQASEKASLSQSIAGTEIEIEYSRPSIRGRGELFGGQIYWGEVWTPGANLATTLRVSKPIELNGVELPAGKYTLWIEVLESEPWNLVVHEDTVRGHGNHPLVEEGLIAVPIEHSESPRFIETLSFDIQDIRPTKARLEMTWGNTLVHMELGIDPGFEIAVDPDVAKELTGTWLYDDSAQLPSEEEIEAQLANAPEEYLEMITNFFTSQRDMPRPRAVEVAYDPESGYLTLSDPIAAATMRAGLEDSGLAAPDDATLLLPRGSGTFMMGNLMGGELASYNPQFSSLIEFEFDDEGRAVSFVERAGNDELNAMALRPGGS